MPTLAQDFAQSLRQRRLPDRLADLMGWVGAPPSPLVRAIADASEGRPVELDDLDCRLAFGCPAAQLPRVRPRIVVVRAGRGGGKTSHLLAPYAIFAALTVPIPLVQPGEVARVVIIAPDRMLGAQALSFVRGYIDNTPELRQLVIQHGGVREDGTVGTSDKIVLRRPDGKRVEIRYGAANRGGRVARGTTLVAVLIDEACFFYADSIHAVTDQQIVQAVMPRLVPGGQLWVVSTPWVKSVGVLEELMDQNWGRHVDALCATGSTLQLFPGANQTEMERDRRRDPISAAREYDAIPLPQGGKVLLPADAIDAAAVGQQEPPVAGARHYAGCDLAFRRNSSALAIARRTSDGRVHVVLTEELQPRPGSSLKPSEVCGGFARTCLAYGVRQMRGDLHYSETAREELARYEDDRKRRVSYDEWNPTRDNMAEVFMHLRRLMTERLVILPREPRLIHQMRNTMYEDQQGGSTQIHLPKQGAAHGDLLMAVALAAFQVPLHEPGRSLRRAQSGYRLPGDTRGFG